jgi:hypothetical protein
VADKAIAKIEAYAKNDYQESMMHYHKYLNFRTKAKPTFASKISKRQIGHTFGLMETAFSALNTVQIINRQKQSVYQKHGQTHKHQQN